MPKRRTTSLVISLMLAFALLAPSAALGRHASEDPTAAVSAGDPGGAPSAARGDAGDAADDLEDDAAATGDDAQQPKRKGNSFARALAAPFRALARLFGGGKKSEAAKKSSTPSTREAAATPNGAGQNAAPEASQAGKGDDSPQPPQSQAAQTAPLAPAQVEPITTPAAPPLEAAQSAREPVPQNVGSVAAPASQGPRIVRPSEGEVARESRPQMWIPLIVGVPADALSQGRALLQHGYIQEAIAELQIAATVGPQLVEANNLLGLAYDRLGWHRQAAAAYERALTISPKDYVVLANLGYSLYLDEDFAGALRRLKQAAKIAPSEPVISNNLGVVNARLGRYGDAYKDFARASNEYEAHLKLAGILEDQRRDKDAVKHYEAALRIQPGATVVLERLVALYERTGNRDKADTARRALSQPKNPQKTATGGGG